MLSLILVFLCNIFIPAPAASFQNPVSVQREVTPEKTRFIVFSGSDWCKGCIQFRKKVLDDPSFAAFASKNLNIVIADFPQKIKLPADIVRQNEALAEQYNPKGVFPNLVLLSPDGSRFDVIEYSNQTPQEFIKEMENHLQRING